MLVKDGSVLASTSQHEEPPIAPEAPPAPVGDNEIETAERNNPEKAPGSEVTIVSSNPTSSTVMKWIEDLYAHPASTSSSASSAATPRSRASNSRYNFRPSPSPVNRMHMSYRTLGGALRGRSKTAKRKASRKPTKRQVPKKRKTSRTSHTSVSSSGASSTNKRPTALVAAALDRMRRCGRYSKPTKKNLDKHFRRRN